MLAIQVSRFGGPEVLELVDAPPPTAQAGELLVEVAVAGVNFRDLLHRAGLFGARLPFVPGTEGAGVVLAVSDAPTGFAVGDRVAWKLGPSYAEQVVVAAAEAVHVPDALSFEQAAGCCLQGLTAHFLTTSTFSPVLGQTALVHAGAGGVGLLLTQMVKRRGGRVISTVSNADKADRARTAGADEVVVYGNGDDVLGDGLVATVRELTGGSGADVVYDGVGRTTFDASLASCKQRGLLVLYGASSGNVPPFDIMRLMASGSVVLARPSVRDFTTDRAELDWRAAELFSWVASGEIEVAITERFSLDQAGAAQDALSSRRSTGKLVITL
jgi:NADPH2:quinone reductase